MGGWKNALTEKKVIKCERKAANREREESATALLQQRRTLAATKQIESRRHISRNFCQLGFCRSVPNLQTRTQTGRQTGSRGKAESRDSFACRVAENKNEGQLVGGIERRTFYLFFISMVNHDICHEVTDVRSDIKTNIQACLLAINRFSTLLHRSLCFNCFSGAKREGNPSHLQLS